MTRILWMLSIVSFLLINVGCGTMCNRKPLFHRNPPPAKPVYVPPPPPAPTTLVPAGAIGPPTGAFAPPPGAIGPPTTPFPQVAPSGPGFAAPSNPFPQVPPTGGAPSISPSVPKDGSRTDSKWTPGITDTQRAQAQAPAEGNTPRVQLYAPEANDKEPPLLNKKPGALTTFPPIAQFAEVKGKVYNGLRPNADGLDWLQTNRNGTVIQVRLPDEDDAAFKKQVEDRGMRYVAFEISPMTLTKEKADEFIKLIRDDASTGVFVFDADGSLSGAMWYLYMRWAEVLNDETAQLQARRLACKMRVTASIATCGLPSKEF